MPDCIAEILRIVLTQICVIFFITIPSITGTSTEDQFCEKYGNHINDSGIWDHIRKYGNVYPAFWKSVCNQVHQKAKLGPPNVNAFVAYTSILKYTTPKYQPIEIDLILYSVANLNSTEMKRRFWFITKGLMEDCVYYLRPEDENATLVLVETDFYLTDQHICDIDFTMPE